MKRALCAALAATILIATPAHADAWEKREIAYQVLNVIDMAQTLDCLDRNICHETNPLLGRNPSAQKLIAVKAVGGALHYAIARALRDRDPDAAKWFQIISIAVQGGVVAANARFTF